MGVPAYITGRHPGTGCSRSSRAGRSPFAHEGIDVSYGALDATWLDGAVTDRIKRISSDKRRVAAREEMLAALRREARVESFEPQLKGLRFFDSAPSSQVASSAP